MLHRGRGSQVEGDFRAERVMWSDPRSPTRDRRGGLAVWEACQVLNIENEGTSHDVIENKGPAFLSHDVIDK